MSTTEHKMAVPKPHVLNHACVNPVSGVTNPESKVTEICQIDW